MVESVLYDQLAASPESHDKFLILRLVSAWNPTVCKLLLCGLTLLSSLHKLES
jgi:hypothetical protein